MEISHSLWRPQYPLRRGWRYSPSRSIELLVASWNKPVDTADIWCGTQISQSFVYEEQYTCSMRPSDACLDGGLLQQYSKASSRLRRARYPRTVPNKAVRITQITQPFVQDVYSPGHRTFIKGSLRAKQCKIKWWQIRFVLVAIVFLVWFCLPFDDSLRKTTCLQL